MPAPRRSKAAAAAHPTGLPVSSGNPCPFLRALVAQGMLNDEVEPLPHLAATITRVARAGDGEPRLPDAAIRAIAAIATGLAPWAVARNAVVGVHLNGLRGGPLDKKGVGSGILDARAQLDEAQLQRVAEFASPKTKPDGSSEPGLSLKELKQMMDANFERAAGRRRLVDRKLMDGEWPILLKVLGQDGTKGRYLSVADIHTLFAQRRLPERMAQRL